MKLFQLVQKNHFMVKLQVEEAFKCFFIAKYYARDMNTWHKMDHQLIPPIFEVI